MSNSLNKATDKLAALNEIDLAANILRCEFFKQLEPIRPLDLESLNRVLVIAPHQDDETIGAGGTLLSLKAREAETHILFLTDGNQVSPTRPVSNAETRRSEAKSACRMLGARTYELGINNIKPDPDLEHLEKMAEQIHTIKPDAIMLPWFLGQPKHRAACHFLGLCDMLFPMKSPQIIGYQAHNTLMPSHYVDITPVIEQKREVMTQYRSQNEIYRRYDHIAEGLAAWNSRFLPITMEKPQKRYVELFLTTSMEQFRKIIRDFYLDNLEGVYSNSLARMDGYVSLQKQALVIRKHAKRFMKKTTDKLGPPELEDVPCPLCGECDGIPLRSIPWRGVILEFQVCSECGLVYMKRRPTEKWRRIFYKRAFWEERTDSVIQRHCQSRKLSFVEALRNRMEGGMRRSHKILGILNNHVKINTDTHVLEIGAGFGDAIGRLRMEKRCSASVVEPSEIATELGKIKYGVQPAAKFIEELDGERLLKGTIDLVIMSHVLENTTDPVRSLKIVGNVMKDDGLLYIDTPHLFYHPHAINPYHNVIFSPWSLKTALACAGFQVEHLICSENPEKLDGKKPDMYLTILAKKASPVKTIPKGNAKRVVELWEKGMAL